jgi:hypothetical protein
MRPDWRAERYRKAVITGPAKVTLRYPATVEVRSSLRQRLRRHARADDPQAIAARRLSISADSETPMFVGKTIRIPVGGEVRFQ